MRIFLPLFFYTLLFSKIGLTQCTTGVQFSLNDTVCNVNEISINNTSIGIVNSSWDFYPRDLTIGITSPTIKFSNSDTITDSRGVSFAIDTVSDKVHSFIVERSMDRIIGIELDSSLTTANTILDFGNPNAQLTDARTSMRFKENVGFVSNYNPSKLVSYFFSSGLDQAPDSVHTFTNTALAEFSNPGNLRIVEEDGKNYLLVCNNSGTRHLTILDLDSNLANTPSLVQKVDNLNTTSNSNYAVDIDVVKICNNYIVYTLLNNGSLTILNFGNSITNQPTKSVVPQVSIGSSATNIKVIHEEGKVMLFCLGFNNSINSFQFDSSGLVFEKDINTQSTLFGTGSNDTRSFDLIKINSTYKILGCNRSGAAIHRGVYLGSFGNENLNPLSVSSAATPSNFPYLNPGKYYMSLTGIDSFGNISSQLDSIVINDFIQADFSSTGQCLDLPSSFYDLSSSQLLSTDSWHWDFGDGDTSTLQNPTHQFNASGDYTVQLEIEANNGCKSSLFDTLTISDLRPENPGFDYFPKVVCENTLLSFYDSTTVIQDSVITYFWDFGDGDTSSLQNPTHQYTLAGNYTVSLSLSGRFGCDTTISKIISVQAGPAPFLSAEDFCIGAPTQFTDSSFTAPGSNIIRWKWDFGDGDTSIIQNPIHTYLTSGQYAVSIEVETNSGCVASNSKIISIEDLPVPNFSFSTPCAQGEAVFTDESNGSIVSWEWKNNLNPTDSSSSPVFSFPNVGFQDVTLTIVNASGCSDSTTQTFEVFPALLPDFSVENICLNDTTQFNDLTNGFSVISYAWEFDFFNQSSVQENPKFYYPNTGTYNVSLSVTNAIGCMADTTKTIEIKDLPTAIADVDNNCIGSPTLFYDNSLVNGGTVSDFNWQIEGLSFDEDSITYIFNDSGTYSLVYEIIDNFACADDTSFSFSIHELPDVDFTFTPNYGTAPITIQFDNLSSGGVNYFWKFGENNNTSFDENPSYDYANNGEYEIVLIVENIFNCRDSVLKTIPIIPTELDLELDNLSVQETTLADGTTVYKPRVLLKNVGSRTIENFYLKASINQETKIVETWTGTLGIGQSVLYELNSSFIIADESLLDYLCVEGFNVNDNTEINLTNNKLCEIQKGLIQFSSLYPNPSQGMAYLDVVLAKKGTAQIGVFDVLGKELLNYGDVSMQEGFNQISFDCRNFQAGNYFVKMIFRDEVYSQTLTIRNK